MEHYRLKKYRGPETWARVRVAYEMGESGPSVARRFDVGLANLRKKARLERWTRKDMARKRDQEMEPLRSDLPAPAPDPVSAVAPTPPVDLRDAVGQAMQRAGALLAEGRGNEAQALVRSAESLARLVERIGTPEPRDEAASKAAMDRYMAERDADVIEEATKLARALLMDEPVGESARYSAFLYHWRALHLGPEATARDFAHAVKGGGGASRYFDGEGRLRPLPEPITPLGYMVDVHLRLCAKLDPQLNGGPTPPSRWTMDLTYPGPIRSKST